MNTNTNLTKPGTDAYSDLQDWFEREYCGGRTAVGLSFPSMMLGGYRGKKKDVIQKTAAKEEKNVTDVMDLETEIRENPEEEREETVCDNDPKQIENEDAESVESDTDMDELEKFEQADFKKNVETEEKETAEAADLEETEEDDIPVLEAIMNDRDPQVHRCIMVDTENVANRWYRLFQQKRPEDNICIFYTEKSANLPYDLVRELIHNPEATKIKWINCFQGLNALDFQLVTELGCMIGKDGMDSNTEYYIFSADHGYDAVCKYWATKGVKVTRISNNNCFSDTAILDEIRPLENHPICVTKKKTAKEQLEDILLSIGVKDTKVSAQEIVTLSSYIPLDNDEVCKAFLKALLEPGYGGSVAKKISGNEELLKELSLNRKLSLSERKKSYLTEVLKMYGFSAKDIKVIAPSAPSLRRKCQLLNTHRKYIENKYGPKESKRLYGVIEAHAVVLEMLH